MMITCCHHCTERHLACHDTCEKYLAEKKAIEDAKESIRQKSRSDKEIYAYRSAACRAAVRRKEGGKKP